MVSNAVGLSLKTGEIDLLRSRWMDPKLGRFTSYDTFEGPPSNPAHLQKYAYCGDDPINHVDPSGHDFTELMVTVGIGALLGGISAAGVNYALGRPQTFSSIAYGALLGGIAGPLALAFPVFGVGLAAYGIYGGWNLMWQVWTNPRSTKGQLAASLVIFGASLFGGYGAGKNLATNGWYNPVFEQPPTTPLPGLTRQSPLEEIFQDVPDDAMVHVSKASPAQLAEGVRGSLGTNKSYWFRWGDVKHLTPTQYRNIVGELAEGGQGDAATFAFKLVAAGEEGQFQPGGKAQGGFQEYEARNVVKPDASGVVSPTGN